MPRKGMRTLNWFSPKHPSTHHSSPSASPSRFMFSPPRPSFSEAVIDRTVEMAEPVIMKWDPDTSTYAKVTSLFYESRREAEDFIKHVRNLQKAMQFHASEDSRSDKLVRAQSLMQVAMKRLQKEFYQILSMNKAHLDPESISASTVSSRASTRSSTSEFDVEDDDYDEALIGPDFNDFSSIVMENLRLIAECMIYAGYGKECMKIYKDIRKSIIDEGILRLGVEKLTSSQVRKMDWEVLDLKIKDWLDAVDIAVKTLFNGERILNDYIFASKDSIRELCFTEISKEGAMTLFSFPENVARNSKKSPEKMFRLLDMYTAIAEHWPEIESIFSFKSESVIRSQALTSLVKLGEGVRTEIAEFETALQKESSKTIVAGGGIHALTIDAMDYIVLLADYSKILSDILGEAPPSPAKSSLPESYFGIADSDESPAPAISLRFAWLILVLLCKLDAKAKHYKEVSLAYLFLANNLQYIVQKVRSSNLKYLLGDNWLKKQEGKIKQFITNYERFGWSHVINSLPREVNESMAPQQVKEIFKKFNSLFEQAHRKHSVGIVSNSKLRDHLKVSIAKKILPMYMEFYNTHKHTMARERHSGHVIRFSPEDVGHHLSDLFFAPFESGSSSSSVESSPSRTIPLV